MLHRPATSRLLRFTTLCIWALALVCARADEPGPKPPDRRELWVPFDKLGHVLDEKAVLLSREQYDALLRDAGVDKPKKTEAPAGVVLTSAVYRAVPEGRAASIHGELIVNVLRDGWNELPLEFHTARIGSAKVDGEAVLLPEGAVLRAAAVPAQGKAQAPQHRQAILLIRGRGEHRVTLELNALIDTTAGVNTLAAVVPGAASGTFTLTLPAGATMEKSAQAMKVTTAPDATTAVLALSPSLRVVVFAWKIAGAAAAQLPARAQAKVRYAVDAEKVTGNFVIRAETALGALPEAFEFTFPPEMKINSVRANELQGWNAAAGKVTATFQPGERKNLDIEIDAELPALAGKDLATIALPLPVLKGVPRIDGILFIAGGDDVIVQNVAIGSALRRIPTSEDRGERGYFGAYEFAGGAAGPRVTVERALPRLETDIDTLVEFRTDAIFLTRTVTLREQKGRRFSATITLPAEEELIEVRRIEEPKPVVTPPPVPVAAPVPGSPPAPGAQARPAPPPVLAEPTECEPEWTREGGRILIKWSDETAKPRVFRLRSRVEPEKWTQMPPEGLTFPLGDAKIGDAAKVAGYIALTADPAFRLEAQPGETLERRDGRSTPVRGDYAWFRRDAFDLKVKVARRPAEVLAALTGYALPLEGLLDVRASMNYQFMGGGTRTVRIRVPKDLAQNFHFEGPQIAERALADDVWTITFQKELTGAYELGIAAQVPVAKQAGGGAGGAKGYSFAVKVPVISPLDVARASGLWAVEANTETEIRFDATGMNELDSLLAPEISGYKPRHRVIGVFGWLGTEYSLALNGVRHAAAGMLTAVVDTLELNTVISTSGLHQHEAIYRLRASGVEYLDVALPKGAQVLSVAVDGKAVKPVAANPGSVRLPLPARRDTDTPVVASLTYETPAAAWKNRGTLALAAPAIAREIPVLNSRWRVWVPEGFSFSDFESNLPVPEVEPEHLLVRKIGAGALAVITSPFEAKTEAEQAQARRMTSERSAGMAAPDSNMKQEAEYERPRPRSLSAGRITEITTNQGGGDGNTSEMMRKLHTMIIPKISFNETTVAEALEFLAKRSKELDPEGRGVVLKLDAGAVSNARITLTLINVPVIEVIKYVTQLADLKFKIGSSAVTIVPLGSSVESLVIRQWKVPPDIMRAAHAQNRASDTKEWLASLGVVFGQGASVSYSSQTGILQVRNSPEQLDVVSHILEDMNGEPDRDRPAKESPPPAEAPREPAIAKTGGATTVAIQRKLNSIIIPKIDFKEVTVRDAIDFLVKKSKELDPEGEGISIVVKLGDEGNASRITLTLNNVPLIEVIKYITNLANLKYKLGPFAVAIVPLGTPTENLVIRRWRIRPGMMRTAAADPAKPEKTADTGKSDPKSKDWLASMGVVFGEGTFAMYDPMSNTLLVKNTPDQLDIIERIVESQESGPAAGKTAGLLPVSLDLPKGGSALVFGGLYAPERLVMHYDDWWSRAQRLWMWFVGGGVAFYVLVRRRPWLGTLWAVLVLSAVPLCVSAAWMPVCNALLGGWLVVLVLNRIGTWCVFRNRREVLA